MIEFRYFMKTVVVGVGRGGVDGGGGGNGGGAAFNDSYFVVVFFDAGAESNAEAVGHICALVPGHGKDKPIGLIGIDLWGKEGGKGGKEVKETER